MLHCIALLYDSYMSENIINDVMADFLKEENAQDSSVWIDTKGIAKHFNMKPNTLRKQRVKQSPTTLPYHLIGGNVRYNIIECEKFVGKNKKDYATNT